MLHAVDGERRRAVRNGQHRPVRRRVPHLPLRRGDAARRAFRAGVEALYEPQLRCAGRGAVVELNRQMNEPVEILANEIPIAKGEVIVTDEGYIGVKITELLTSQKDVGGLLVGKVGTFGK